MSFDIELRDNGAGSFDINLSSGSEGYIKVWDGASWVKKPVKDWTGSAWVTKPLKFWNGSTWVTTT